MSKTVKKAEEMVLDIETKAETLAAMMGRKKELDDKIKPLKLEIIEYVDANKATLFKDAKTYKLGGLEISIKPDHTYALGDDFDLVKFYKSYPDAVKFSLSHTNMKNVPMEKFDISHEIADKIEVALPKEKKTV